MSDTIVLVDYGSQYTHLIAKVLKNCNLTMHILYELPDSVSNDVRGIILSGGPNCVLNNSEEDITDKLYKYRVPILGICFGAQFIANAFGISIVHNENCEYGRTNVKISNTNDLFHGITKKWLDVWMSHSDSIERCSQHREIFRIISQSENGTISGFQINNANIYGLLFHPEVSHTEYGDVIIENFVFNICEIRECESPNTNLSVIETYIGQTIQDGRVLMAVSGGVDSSVAASLIQRVIGNRLHCVFIDNGLLRHNEFEEVLHYYTDKMNLNVVGIDARNIFYRALRGVTSPEKKRKIIGKVFIDVFKDYASKISDNYFIEFLGQGTIYSDVIESSSRKENANSRTIKSHHNVGGLPKDLGFKLVEPLKELFKDEVRDIGCILGLPGMIINRHPFPGPGLAIRIMGEITEKKICMLQKADYIFINMLKEENLYDKIWQAGAILLNTKSVGVMGDNRTYNYVIALRAVCSKDGMTAIIYPFDMDFLARVSTKIINNVEGVNRVVYDISSKPPATIEWE